MEPDRMRIGVLISGSGTNLQAIIDATEEGRLDAEVAVVISNKENAYGLERAGKADVPAVWIDRTEYTTFRAYNEAIRDVLLEYEVDVVAMAGYMRLLSTEVLDAFPDRVVNIHPSLLPSFAGPSGIREAFEYGVKVTGVTIHFANEKFDEGPIIAQEVVEVAEDDTIQSLEERIHEAEHRLYPRVLQLLAEGRVAIDGRKARIEGLF
ncbi:MAG: phosphoribosylglycinamide formyltransferase [Anaerosomatales bacterium]|nr:phosphoribosylglycinamide formyltransferase [Anaerosomatales bacterium]MDT8434891.1 phosphoribosylglycinamide formyltransferase [Anaerosomatales bacterium]